MRDKNMKLGEWQMDISMMRFCAKSPTLTKVEDRLKKEKEFSLEVAYFKRTGQLCKEGVQRHLDSLRLELK